MTLQFWLRKPTQTLHDQDKVLTHVLQYAGILAGERLGACS
jgi:hypothetical protein